MLTQRKLVPVLILAFAGPTLAQTASNRSDHYAAITNQRVHAVAMQASEDLNKTLPFTINSETRADTSVVGPGRRFTYLLTDVSAQSKTVTLAQIESETGSSLRNKVCTTAALKLLIDNDYLITYEYFDIDGKLIGDVAVNRRDCARGS